MLPTIESINQLLLPPFLFFTYFCFISIIYYLGQQQKTSQKPQSTPDNFSYGEAFSSAFEPTPDLENQLLSLIDQFSKRQLRKLCHPLDIKQKTNGVEKSTDLMRAAIRRKCKENPQQIVCIIRQRLPDLILPASVKSEFFQHQAS
jgi:hypothetical protein